MRRALPSLLLLLALAGCVALETPDSENPAKRTSISSLSDLSITSLRERQYGSELEIVSQLGDVGGDTEYSHAYGETGSGPYATYLTSYSSDGLRLYSRLDLPNGPPPAEGFPIIIFCHGWIGVEGAPGFHFSYTPESMYAELIDGYVDAGFIVLTPGYRGHGTVQGIPADGIEFMEAWDNATYLAPIFYAVDVLNLLEGLSSIENLDFSGFEAVGSQPPNVDLDRIFLAGHSQGGDVVLTAMAIAGEGSQVNNQIAGASIADGTFAGRIMQLEFYAAMQGTRRAFLTGDGGWNGTAVGDDNSINDEFVFGYPPDWIETPKTSDWTWQNDRWPDLPVSEVVNARIEEMYSRLREQVVDLSDVQPRSPIGPSEMDIVDHDARVADGMALIDAYSNPHFLREPLILHYSDQDFYSPPDWNEEICRKSNAAGGHCRPFLYKHKSHLLRPSQFEWFSPAGTKDSYRTIIARDVRFFLGLDPSEIVYP